MMIYDNNPIIPADEYNEAESTYNGCFRVFLNPGHAPDCDPDPGAINVRLGAAEATEARRIAERVAYYLEKAYVQVDLMQSDNLNYEEPDLEGPSVVEAANQLADDIFVSIHCNSFNSEARGCETLCYEEYDEEGNLTQAGSLANHINRQVHWAISGIDGDFPNRGVKERPNLIVLRDTDMPAVIVETGFIDNDEDCQLIQQHYDDYAAAIARGITDYFCELAA